MGVARRGAEDAVLGHQRLCCSSFAVDTVEGTLPMSVNGYGISAFRLPASNPKGLHSLRSFRLQGKLPPPTVPTAVGNRANAGPISTFPLPDSHFPLPNSHFLLPNSKFRFPTSPFPLPISNLQPPTSHLLHTLPRTARYFTVDKLQQVYLVDDDNAVYKYSPDGKELFYYNNNTRGTLGYIDVTDPFNLLLFYPELQAIATLDRTLNETGVLPLFSAGIVNATAIGLAIDNNVWVYDQANFQLKKVGQDGQVLLASDNLSAQLIQAPQATQLTAQNNMLYLNCPGQGIFVFDNFGQFHQLLPYEKVEEVQLLDGKVVMYEPNQVRAYHLETLKEHTLRDTIPADSILQVRYQGNRYYQLTKAGKVEVYRRP